MIAVIVCSKRQEERSLLIRIIKDAIADAGDEMSTVKACTSALQALQQSEGMETVDILCMDVSDEEGIRAVKEIRRDFGKVRIALLADTSVSPDNYIRPDIMASALLLRPFTEEKAKNIMRDFMGFLFEDWGKDKDEELYIMVSKDGIRKIPFRKILYYEARTKKIFVRLKSEEYGYYGTLESLLEELPAYFVRCHRGIIVNGKKIVCYDASQSQLVLEDGGVVPVSKSFRGAVREFVREM